MIPLVDGHNDVLVHVAAGRPFHERSSEGHIDLPRARESGLAGGFFAVFVDGKMPTEPDRTTDGWAMQPLPPLEARRARRESTRLVELLLRLEADGLLAVARTTATVEAALAGGPLAAIMHLEGAEPVGARLGALEDFYERGVRSIGIVWSRPNAFGEGVPFGFPGSPDVGGGLTAAGRRLVTQCNKVGILVDLAHLNLRGFFDAARVSEAPLVVTHTGAHALCPVPRNLTDEQLDAVAESGGVVGIAFDLTMLVGVLALETPIDPILDHVDHMVERMGIDHVAFGSDFDGCTVSTAIGDVSGYPRVLDGLRRRGYGEDALAKLAHGNWLRALRATWKE